ncbi:MAG: hypothetical protein J6575_05400 [Bifidobacterium sp.]|nr:hypothetical protein [Bifidobacterium sp.]
MSIMNNTAGNIDALKQGIRHEAIAKRKGMRESERAEAGARLGKLVISLLDNLQNESNGGSSCADSGAETSDANHSRTVSTNGSCDIDTDHTLNIETSTPIINPYSGDTAAAYVSMGTEVPTLGLLDELGKRGLRVLVPRLGSGRDIRWSEYGGKSGLREMPRTATGGLRPAEPDGRTLGPEAIADAGIVFIPAFAIDLDGTRLGRGGGWYDQVLGLCRPDALKIGVCWDWEFTDRHHAVPSESHDIAVDAALTPERFIRLR